MNNDLYKLGLKKDKLFENSLITSIAHAIMMCEYYDLSYENSWDKYNCNMQDSSGIRATITFKNNYCIGAFQKKSQIYLDYFEYFKNVPSDILKIAENDTLQYLLLNNNENQTTPCINGIMWNINNEMYCNIPIDHFFQNGASIFEKLFLKKSQLIKYLIEYYEMELEHINLLRQVIDLKNGDLLKKVIINQNYIKDINFSPEAWIEFKTSFNEINVFIDK